MKDTKSRVFLSDGRGNWTSEGCETESADDPGVITCRCNHLTNFACLVVS